LLFSSLARARIAAFFLGRESFLLLGRAHRAPFVRSTTWAKRFEPLQPRADALEGVGHEHARASAADLLRRDELRLLEQPDVLRHPGQRHAERLGQFADRRAAAAEPFEDGAAGRVAESRESKVDAG